MRYIGPVEHRDSTLIKRLYHHIAAWYRNQRSVMRDTVFLVRLRSGNFVVAVEDQIFVFDGKQGISAPFRFIGNTTARLRSASPLIGTQHLASVIIESRRMPERHVVVACHVDAKRMRRVMNLEQQTEPGARAAG